MATAARAPIAALALAVAALALSFPARAEQSVSQRVAGGLRARESHSEGVFRARAHEGRAAAADPSECRTLGFVHIPKTGGTSVLKAIRSSTVLKERTYFVEKDGQSHGQNHYTAVEQAHRSPEAYSAAETFATVRNPYSWAVSQYDFRRWLCEHEPGQEDPGGVKWPGCLTNLTFSEWVKEHDRRRATGLSPRFMWKNVISTRLNHACDAMCRDNGCGDTSQLYWLTDCGQKRWAVKHIVRLEDHESTAVWMSKEGLEWIACNASEAALRGSVESRAPTATAPFGAPIWRPPADDAAVHELLAHASATRANSIGGHCRKDGDCVTSDHSQWSALYDMEACGVIARRFLLDFVAFGYDVFECERLVAARDGGGRGSAPS